MRLFISQYFYDIHWSILYPFHNFKHHLSQFTINSLTIFFRVKYCRFIDFGNSRKYERKTGERRTIYEKFSSPRMALAGDNCLSHFSPYICIYNSTYITVYAIHVYTYVYGYILAVREERGKRYEVHGLKRKVVISPGLVPETLVKLSCGLIIINRVGTTWLTLQTVRGIRLSSYFSFRVFSIGESAESTDRIYRVPVIEFYIYV